MAIKNKIFIFAKTENQNLSFMEKLTKEEALRRFMSAKQKKEVCIERMKQELSSVYEQRTGKKIENMFVL